MHSKEKVSCSLLPERNWSRHSTDVFLRRHTQMGQLKPRWSPQLLFSKLASYGLNWVSTWPTARKIKGRSQEMHKIDFCSSLAFFYLELTKRFPSLGGIKKIYCRKEEFHLWGRFNPAQTQQQNSTVQTAVASKTCKEKNAQIKTDPFPILTICNAETELSEKTKVYVQQFFPLIPQILPNKKFPLSPLDH